MTIYGLDVHGVEVEASVFAEKLKNVLSALKKLDSHYNAHGQHKFMINWLEFSSAIVSLGIVAELSVEAGFPLTPVTSCHAPDLGSAEGVEAVHEGDADVDFGGLPVRVS